MNLPTITTTKNEIRESLEKAPSINSVTTTLKEHTINIQMKSDDRPNEQYPM